MLEAGRSSMERPMKRKDRQMEREPTVELLKASNHVFLATTNEDGTPYCVPINSVMTDEQTLYFHGLSVGQKIDNIKRDPRVCIACAHSGGVATSDQNREGFVLEFESCIATGVATEVKDLDEKKNMLKLLCLKSIPRDLPAYQTFAEAVERSAKVTTVYRVTLASISGKKCAK
jgi:uncharacterized protein